MKSKCIKAVAMMTTKTKLNLLSIFLILIMFASWIFNFGWIRLALTFILFPLIQAVIFFIANRLSAKNIHIKPVRLATILSYVTFLLPHFLILDGGDIGELYIFFHLIESNRISEITSRIGYFFMLVHIVSVVLQFVLFFKYRKQGVQLNEKK